MKDTTGNAPKRSTYVAAEDPLQKLTDQQRAYNDEGTIAELKKELAATQKALAEALTPPADGVTLTSYLSESTGISVIEIDTHEVERVKVYLNEGVLFDGNPEVFADRDEPASPGLAAIGEAEEPEGPPLNGFFVDLNVWLMRSSSGPHAVLDEVGRRDEIERATYIAEVRRARETLVSMVGELTTYESQLLIAEQML